MGSVEDFAGQVAIVTGGGTGLGKSIALELGSRGASVVIASRNEEHLIAAAKDIEAKGAEVLTVSCDVREAQQVEELVKKTINSFGKVDVLVNNAAGNFIVPAEKLTPNGWNAVVGIVLNGSWYCSSMAGQEMIKQGSGCILNIIATYAWTGAPGVVHSASAKAGVLAMTRTLAAEWGRYGIRVNALAPGVMATSGASKNLMFDSEKAQEMLRAQIPLRRLTTPEEIAKLAAFLCSNEASYITGDVVTADGGRWLADKGFLELYDLQAAGR
ncbi:MAG: 2,4-dienoyl-CoA reductase [Candidatus Melainabacteria bacterium]|nr:2,4-dienoyl-CoA reductase [Candidatus Melainabacteria bacterium]